jgi:serine/threonine protein kinase
MSKLLEKQPEKRITAAEALNHPFLIKDRPIFKFKKVYREEGENENVEIPMKVYKNLEDIEYE